MTMQDKLMNVRSELQEVHDALVEANKGDKQLDYTTNPSIANLVDSVTELAKKIDNIMYQRGR